jgi:hypothetical protein
MCDGKNEMVPYSDLFYALYLLTCGPVTNIKERAHKIFIVNPLESVRVVGPLNTTIRSIQDASH